MAQNYDTDLPKHASVFSYRIILPSHFNFQYILSSGKDGSAHLWELTSGAMCTLVNFGVYMELCLVFVLDKIHHKHLKASRV